MHARYGRSNCAATALLHGLLITLGLVISTQLCVAHPGPTVHIGGVVPSPTAAGEWAVQVVGDGCDAILTPPVQPQDGGLFEFELDGDVMTVRIGYVAGGILNGCPTPQNPHVFTLGLGALNPGTYQMHLVGVTSFVGGTELTDLDSALFTIPVPPVDVPITGPHGVAWLALLIAIAGIAIFRSRAQRRPSHRID